MKVRALPMSGAWEFTPVQHADDRGVFLEWFQGRDLEAALGHPMRLRQANHSISRAGTLRGLHFADVPPGQAKYVYCPRGALLDVVVDIRVGSPTFGASEAVRLDEVDRRALYISEGLGHAFLALTDDATLTYLCSTGYDPSREHTISPVDPDLKLPWPADIEPILSARDAAAPTLAEALEKGMLPDWQSCQDWYGQLRAGA